MCRIGLPGVSEPGGARIRADMQIELLRMSSAGLTPVEVFSTVFVVPLVVHGCIKTNGTKVTHNFLIGALDDAVRLFRVSCGEGMLDL